MGVVVAHAVSPWDTCMGFKVAEVAVEAGVPGVARLGGARCLRSRVKMVESGSNWREICSSPE